MSTMRVVAIIGACLLLAGCAPVVGLKSVAAFLVAIAAAVGAGWGMMHDKDEIRVCEKARALDEAVSVHVKKYHRTPSGDTVVSLGSANKGNGVAEPDTAARQSQRV